MGGSRPHHKLRMANLVASLVAAEAIVTTEAKARPCAGGGEDDHQGQKGGLHNHRQVVAYLNDKEVAAKLFDEIGPPTRTVPGRYTHPEAGPAPRRQRRWPASSWSGPWPTTPAPGPEQPSLLGR